MCSITREIYNVSESVLIEKRNLFFTGKMVLGLEIGRDISLESETVIPPDETPVRQSRRIAQLKIKEQADRRRIEEESMREIEEKKESEKKKRKKQKVRN